MMRLLLVLTVLLLSSTVPLSATRCRVDSVRSVHHLLAQAPAVVRARVVGAAPPAAEDNRGFSPLPEGQVELRVLEVLKGSQLPEQLVIRGTLVGSDDFNDGQPPFSFVRPSGRRGSCYAAEYRLGSEYLLILQQQGTNLTPYWAALAPTNEQVRGSDDGWVWWVRGYLSAQAQSAAASP